MSKQTSTQAPVFLVVGATGNTGRVVADRLLAAGKSVRLLVRDPAKIADLVARGATVVTGDVTHADDVARALAGAHAAYLMLPPDPSSTAFVARGQRIASNFAAAIRAHRPTHVALLSSVAAHLPSGTGPIVTAHHAEVAVRAAAAEAGTALTLVRAAYFMENALAYAHPMAQDGVLPVFGGGEAYPFPMVATEDIGRTAAAALLEGATGVDIIELVGPREYSHTDVAAAAARVLGRPVVATPLPLEAMVPALTAAGLSADVAGLYREMTQAFAQGAGYDGTGRRVRGTVEVSAVLARLGTAA